MEAYFSGRNLRLVAVAGAGKTSTLVMMARARPDRRLLYLAFNRSVRQDAERKFPPNVEVRTLHSLALKEVVGREGGYRRKLEASGGRFRPAAIRDALGLEGGAVVYAIRSTLETFLRSALHEPVPAMIPPAYRAALRTRMGEAKAKGVEAAILQAVRELWARTQDPLDPAPLFSHDAYVKIWSLSKPRLGGVDALLVDEAQDLDPVFVGILRAQNHLQKVFVGDPRQQIYAFRGAVDAMGDLEGELSRLTWSFRFGEEIAQTVRALGLVYGEPFEIHGKGRVPGEVAGYGFLEGGLEGFRRDGMPLTVLTRTNAGIVDALAAMDFPGRFHVVGGTREIAALMRDAEALRTGAPRPFPHPELALLETWHDLEALAEEVQDPQAAIIVRLGERFDSLAALADYLEGGQTEREEEAPLVLSTAHKAKGREWRAVLLAGDFPPVWNPDWRRRLLARGETPPEEEDNLYYVALTRAKEVLLLPAEALASLAEYRTRSSPPEEAGPRQPSPVDRLPLFPEATDSGGGVDGLLRALLTDGRVPAEYREWASRLLKGEG